MQGCSWCCSEADPRLAWQLLPPLQTWAQVFNCFLGHGDCKWVINVTESMVGGFCKKWCDFRRGFIVEKSDKPKIPFLSLKAVQYCSYTFHWLPLISVVSVEFIQRGIVGRGESHWSSGNCSLTVSLWVKLSVVYFPFIVFGSIFSEGSEDSAGKQSHCHILNIVWNNLRSNISVTWPPWPVVAVLWDCLQVV